jgi:hypothetical protein
VHLEDDVTSTATPRGGLHDDLSPTERHRAGRARRLYLPREALGIVPHTDPLEAVRRLAGEDSGRQSELVAERYTRLLGSPFSYLRGSPAVMAADLATQPRTGLEVQLCGDAHLGNFGLFATPGRRLVFDLDDFDETLPGCFEWDLKRLVTSIAILARTNGHSRRERDRSVKGSVEAYRWAMHSFCGEPTRAVSYQTLTIEDLIAPLAGRAAQAERHAVRRTLRQAITEDTVRSVDRLTWMREGRRHAVAKPPSQVRLVDLRRDVADSDLWTDALEVYARYVASATDADAGCSSSTGPSTWLARPWVSAATGCMPTCCCFRDRRRRTCSSYRSKTRARVSSSRTSRAASSSATASASSLANGGSRRPATPSSAGSGVPSRAAGRRTTTCGRCATGRLG